VNHPRKSYFFEYIDRIIERICRQIPEKFETAKNDGIFCGVILRIDVESGHSLSITPIQIEEGMVK